MKFILNNDQQPLVTDSGEIIFELVGLAVSGEHNPNHSLAQIVIPPGKSSSLHYHKISQETYFILEGEGKMFVDEEKFTLHEGQACLIEPRETHQISNIGVIDLVFLAVCVPAWVLDDSFEV
ncbi:MAG: cupin domain-containing protein [Anaerolineales bacterium]|nr:cupin domain-containing protein [Anaerolineales bacterium]